MRSNDKELERQICMRHLEQQPTWRSTISSKSGSRGEVIAGQLVRCTRVSDSSGIPFTSG